MTDSDRVSKALECRMRDLLKSSPSAMHPLWNYILTDLVPILRWTENYCNSSRVLRFIQRLLKLPPLAFAIVAFVGLVMGLKKCLKLNPRLTSNLLAVAYPTIVSLKSPESENWMTYWCIYAWSSLTDQMTPLLQDPVKSYYIPKMLFFYWMSAKGGASMIYHNVISKVLKRSIQFNSISQKESTLEERQVASDTIEIGDMMDEEVDDSILESVQKSENDESTFSDHDSVAEQDDSTVSDKDTEGMVVSDGLKTINNEVKFSMSCITMSGTLDQAPEAAE